MTKINQTTIEEMVDRNHRLVVYAGNIPKICSSILFIHQLIITINGMHTTADWLEFTGGYNDGDSLGRFALDSCLINNQLGPCIADINARYCET